MKCQDCNDEEVSGIIIGGEYNRYVLFTPAGKRHSVFYEDTMELAEERAAQIVAQEREAFPEHIFALGYGGRWELREY